ncbi:MAG: DNA topoisomerase (ATP-hydrolyzing) subunit B [Chloroflexi bacterium]|nr:DNA topoisomerase (ATP-hydrolyzing) subunit B [Chloroflexota bacterium]
MATRQTTKQAAKKKKAPTNNDYTASDIQVLEGLEAVRRRPGMYIGSTDERGLHHLVYEIVDNAIDEAMAGVCDHIWITIQEDGHVIIRDNGRGIPIGKHPRTGKSALETVMTYLHAGGKFGGGAYKVSGGLHGVGASVVNALSEETWVEVHQKGKIYRQEYVRGDATTKVQQVKKSRYPYENGTGPIEQGTIISFLPDRNVFQTLNYDFQTLAQRFREVAYLTKGVWIHFIDERGDREINFFFDGGVASFVRHLNHDREVLYPRPIYIEREVEGASIEAAIQYNDGFSEAMYSFANCINTIDGGSHLTGFRSALTRVLNDYARKQKLLKEGDPNLSGEDTREGLVAVISVKLAEPQFEGQTKTRLGNPEVKGQVESVVGEELGAFLEENPSVGRRIIEKCVLTARARDAARKAKDLVVRKGLLDGTNLPGKLADCSDRVPENCELYIVEGPSAGGSAKAGRDRRFQAILPLRGKILNIEKARLEKMLAHEELRVLISALGCGFGEQMDMDKLRYHRVIIMTDADVDGAHIRTLLLTFFFRYYREVIDRGYLYIAQPPLYRVQSGKQSQWLYSDQDLERYQKQRNGKNFSMQRYKGLGEMNADQLWETTMDPEKRTLLKVNVENAGEADILFAQLMGEEVAPRKKFIQAHASQVRNLDV